MVYVKQRWDSKPTYPLDTLDGLDSPNHLTFPFRHLGGLGGWVGGKKYLSDISHRPRCPRRPKTGVKKEKITFFSAKTSQKGYISQIGNVDYQ